MTGRAIAALRGPTVARVGCVAQARTRYLVRSRVALVAFVLAALPWFALDRHTPDSELGFLTGAALVGLLASASGVGAESLDDGWYAIASLHGLTPLDLLLGEALGALAGLLPAMTGLAVLSWPALREVPTPALMLCLAWLGVLVTGWLSIMLLLGTCLRGKGNAIAMIPLLVAFAFPSDALPLDRWPAALARIARDAWDAMPLESHATAMYAALLHDATPPPLAPMALLLAPPGFLALATLRLSRLEAAGRMAG